MSFTVVDVNGLNGSLSYGMVNAGGTLLGRTGYLDLGRHIIAANRGLWGEGWEDAIDPKAPHQWDRWWLDEHADVVVAVPPCSGFSGLTGKGAGRGLGNSVTAGASHPSNDCMWSSAKYAALHHPEVYVFESVTGAWKQGRAVMQGLREAMEAISGCRYTLTHWLHDGCVVGAPSSRQRYLFVAVKGDRPFSVVPPGEYAREVMFTTKEAIGDLRPLPLRKGDQILGGPLNLYQQAHRRSDGLVDGHWIAAKGKYHVIHERLFELAEEMGAPWYETESAAQCMARVHAKYGDELIVELMGETIGRRLIANGFNMGPYVTQRECWDALHGLIAGGGPVFHVHPLENRCITYREAARIQGWPDELRIDYDQRTFGKEKLDSVWGKAVMPTVAKHIGQEVSMWLDEESSQTDMGTLIGEREWLIDHLPWSKVLRRQSHQIKAMTRARGKVTSGLT